MGKIYGSVEELVGHTPLLKLGKLMKKQKLKANLLAKCEFYNPSFSLQDRCAINMINKAPFSKINQDTVFIEAADGNLGVSLAMFCASRDYKLIIVAPEYMPQEQVALIRLLGAEVLLTPADEGLDGARKKVEILKQRSDNLLEFRHLENPANVEAHQLTTSMEIMEDTDGNVDAVVCNVQSGGALVGLASTLRSCNPDLYVMAVLNSETKTADLPLYKSELVDEVQVVEEKEVTEALKLTAECEGLPLGMAAATALCGALKLAERPEMEGKNIVVVLSDSVERCLSHEFFNPNKQEQ